MGAHFYTYATVIRAAPRPPPAPEAGADRHSPPPMADRFTALGLDAPKRAPEPLVR
jgi:hypothetical protein